MRLLRTRAPKKMRRHFVQTKFVGRKSLCGIARTNGSQFLFPKVTQKEQRHASCPVGANAEHCNRALALDVHLAKSFGLEARRHLLPNRFGHCDISGLRLVRHAGRDVDGVAPNVELIALLPYYSADNRTGMHADPDLPTEAGIDQRGCHLQSAANGRADRILDLVEETAGGHETVADGFDFLETVPRGHALDDDEQGIEPRNHLLSPVL